MQLASTGINFIVPPGVKDLKLPSFKTGRDGRDGFDSYASVVGIDTTPGGSHAVGICDTCKVRGALQGVNQVLSKEGHPGRLAPQSGIKLPDTRNKKKRKYPDSFYAPDPLPLGVKLQPTAVIAHEPVREVSGVVASRRYPGVLWIHADGGDRPRLFAVRKDGSTVCPPWLLYDQYVGKPVPGKTPYQGVELKMAANIDWEDIAIDDDVLYIADMGNNSNARRDLGIYMLLEPNPEAVYQARVLKWIPVAYPDQSEYPPDKGWTFDSESLFVHNHKLYVLTKHRVPRELGHPLDSTRLYRLDSMKTDEVNTLTFVDEIDHLGGWVTAADVSPDGKTLAVLTQTPVQSVWLFDMSGPDDKFLSHPKKRLVFHGAGQAEALAFTDEKHLVILNEKKEIFTLDTDNFDPV